MFLVFYLFTLQKPFLTSQTNKEKYITIHNKRDRMIFETLRSTKHSSLLLLLLFRTMKCCVCHDDYDCRLAVSVIVWLVFRSLRSTKYAKLIPFGKFYSFYNHNFDFPFDRIWSFRMWCGNSVCISKINILGKEFDLWFSSNWKEKLHTKYKIINVEKVIR